jgi:Zn-dependent protease with chaperone function
MIEANIDPKPLADFMYQMAQDKVLPDGFEWISTHPESEERAKYIMDYIKGKKLKSKPTLSEKEWKEFKDKTEDY